MGGVVNFTEGRPFGAAGKVDLLKGESQAGGVANRKIIRAIVSIAMATARYGRSAKRSELDKKIRAQRNDAKPASAAGSLPA